MVGWGRRNLPVLGPRILGAIHPVHETDEEDESAGKLGSFSSFSFHSFILPYDVKQITKPLNHLL